MNLTKVPTSVFRGTLLATAWLGVVILTWVGLGMYESPYYSFGPSENLVLAFVGIKIDTWGKYTGLVAYILCSCFMKVLSGDWVYPWINAVVMNPEVHLAQSQSTAYFLTNYIWILNSAYNVFFFALIYSQVDLALFTILGSSVGGLVSSYYVIFNEDRIRRGADYFDL